MILARFDDDSNRIVSLTKLPQDSENKSPAVDAAAMPIAEAVQGASGRLETGAAAPRDRNPAGSGRARIW